MLVCGLQVEWVMLPERTQKGDAWVLKDELEFYSGRRGQDHSWKMTRQYYII